MLASQIIAKKRDSQVLTEGEIEFLISGMLDGSIADYQMSAWAMAVLCRGMNPQEIACLTQCMLHSGATLDAATERPRVDKHSTGGIGDKVSLILAPLLACFDVDVPMLSGRGLGITGGTLDKLEAYEGFRCDLSEHEIAKQLQDIGCVITGTTPGIAPADRKLYSLRDVTGTVPSVALITSSILCKKLAERLDALVLDVKFGSGCFMKTVGEARELAESLERTSRELGLPCTAILSTMDQPLGKMVGNACEANESVQVLKGQGPTDVEELTVALCANLLKSVRRYPSEVEAAIALKEKLANGEAFARYIQMIETQGAKFVEALPLENTQRFSAPTTGWIKSIDGEVLGQLVIHLGGGRRVVGDQLNHRVGLEMLVKVGEQVEAGQPIANLFSNETSIEEEIQATMASAIDIVPEPVQTLDLMVRD